MDTKQKFEAPKMERLGSVADMTKTNSVVNFTDVPQGSPVQIGS
jgi:hypothetical protein